MITMYQETALRIFQDAIAKSASTELLVKQGLSESAQDRIETLAKNAWEVAQIFIDNAPAG